jgi:phosphoribosylanthranilate isomerase
VLQLVDAFPDDELTDLHTRHPDVLVMPVVHVRDVTSVAQAVHYAQVADAILLDSGIPMASVKELGGTGRVHDWQVSHAICRAVRAGVAGWRAARGKCCGCGAHRAAVWCGCV